VTKSGSTALGKARNGLHSQINPSTPLIAPVGINYQGIAIHLLLALQAVLALIWATMAR